MKKINYLVLMAAMLLIGTKSWAVTEKTANDETSFQTAWTTDGDVKITLTESVELTKMMWLGTENLNDASRKIEIDLNGYTLYSSVQYAFLLTHGTLKISNSRPASGQVQSTYTYYKNGVFSGSGNLFYVTGSTDKDVDPSLDGANYFTHLEIGEGVIVTQAHYDALITVAELYVGSVGQKAYTADKCCPKKDALTYITNVYAGETSATKKGTTVYSDDKVGTKDAYGNTYVAINKNASKCVAHGVRVDVKGTIDATKYGIKANGNLGSPGWYEDHHKQPGNVVAYSTSMLPAGYTIQATDVNYSPYIYIYPTGRITVLNKAPEGITNKNPVGIYASGYARWKVEGYAEGCNGAVIKSGQVDFTDATVIGTGPVYTEATEQNSGTASSGSGIVVASTDAYAGNIEVSIGGDTEISSQNGYALEEVITAKDEQSDVQVVDITGGSFEGSAAQGSIKITDTTVENGNVEVTGGQIIGGNPSDEGVVSIGGMSLTDFLQDAEEEQGKTHVTVTTNENGDAVMVIVTGETPKGSENISSHDEDDAVNWKHSSSFDETPMSEDITANLKIDQLQINQPYEQTVTVKTGKTLEVGSVVLGEKAKIIVEPGATFIVTKKDGIYAPKASNLILQTQANNPSIFLFNPAVSTNAHPHATVQYKSTIAYRENSSNYQWERFGLPTWKTVESISCDNPTLVTNIRIYSTSGTWENLGYLEGSTFANISKLNKPFVSCNLLPNNLSSTPAGATYTFTGELTGNMDATLNVFATWTAFANSYSAYVDGAEMVAGISGAANVDHAIYMGAPVGNGKYSWYPYDAEWIGSRTLAPMQAFMLYNNGNVAEDVKINYKNSVYDPAVSGGAGAPLRAISNNTAKMRIVVENAQGEWDEVKMTEKSENLTNATKYMNEGMNMYAHSDDQKLGIIAREDLENTYFGFSTVEGGVYTISFTNVEGREFELVDLEANKAVKVAEGNTYTFTAAPNTVADYRFKLVGIKTVPTAVDNLNAAKNQTGIYTIMGQYVGEMNLWNSLPAGVYVVNGEKRVK